MNLKDSAVGPEVSGQAGHGEPPFQTTFGQMTETSGLHGIICSVMEAPMPAIIQAEDGEILLVNRAWTEITGYSPAEIPTIVAWTEKAYGASSSKVQEEIGRLFGQEGRIHEGEYEIRTLSGEKRIWDFSSSSFGELPDGRRVMVSMASDVTERKRSESKAAKASRLYRLLSQVSHVILRSRDIDSLLSEVCRVAVEVGGFQLAWVGLVDEATRVVRPIARFGSPEDYTDRIVVSADDVPEGRGVMGVALRTGMPVFCNDIATDARMNPWRETMISANLYSCAAFPIKIFGRSFGAACVYSSVSDFFDQDEVSLLGELAGNIAFALENMETERRRRGAEAALRLSEARFRRLAENSRDIIVRYDYKDGPRYSYVSPSVEKILGYSPEDFYADPEFGRKLIDPDDRVLSEKELQQSEATRTIERWRHREGHTVWLEVQHVLVRDASGEIVAHEHSSRDVSKRMLAEEALRQQNELLQTIVSNIPVMINFFDADGRFVWGNHQWENTLGWTMADLRDSNLLEKVYPDREYRREAMETIGKADGTWSDFKNRTRDGRTLDVSWANIRLSSGTNVGIGIDLTERKRLDEQLLRAQRLETAGRVAGQVAHDFNNLLGPIMMYPEMIAEELPLNSQARGYCDSIIEAAQHIAEINDDLLALSRRGRLESESVDVNNLVRKIAAQLADAPATLATKLTLSSDLLPARGSTSQLLRVFHNLVSNAREAMGDVGVLRISTENAYVDEPIGEYNRVEQGEYVRISIADTGGGISESIQDRIFDAFFSTKRGTRRGCGLGLTVVQGIVEDHRGFIDLQSEPGVGSTFSVYLPISREMPQVQESRSSSAGSEAILVVDDDAFQRKVITEILEARGFRVSAVGSGEEALVRLADKPVDLVILDVVMPGSIDGVETYRRILQKHPRQKSIFVSGFAEVDRVRAAQEMGASVFLRKPVSVQQLTKAVRQELDR